MQRLSCHAKLRPATPREAQSIEIVTAAVWHTSASWPMLVWVKAVCRADDHTATSSREARISFYRSQNLQHIASAQPASKAQRAGQQGQQGGRGAGKYTVSICDLNTSAAASELEARQQCQAHADRGAGVGLLH